MTIAIGEPVCRLSRSRSPTCARKANRADGRDDGFADSVVRSASEGLLTLCEKAGIPDSHGFLHASRVLAHADAALGASAVPLQAQRALAVRLAALLHDADDKKYFPDCPKGTFPNAERIVRDALASHGTSFAVDAVIDEVAEMIGWVSCSKNGNTIPPKAVKEPELLWPRWADRLEATGNIGIVRCWQYNNEVKAPVVVSTTPRPVSEAEVWTLATPQRFRAYQTSNGKSASMLDHYYDKLLQLGRPPSGDVQNTYLEAEMDKRSAPLVKVCLAYGQTGKLPLDDAVIADMAQACEAEGL